MRLQLITDVKQLQGTWYSEFLPGLSKGKHWNSDSVFVHGDAFALFESVFANAPLTFNPYGPTTISGRQIEGLADELEKLAKAVGSACSVEEVSVLQRLDRSLLQDLPDWSTAKPQIVTLLQDLGSWLRAVSAEDRPVSILGL